MRQRTAIKKYRTLKPTKPDGCPLTPSGGGSWIKKISGRIYTFGPWHDLEGALKRYYANIDFIRENGYQPDVSDLNQITVRELANRYLAAQNERADALEGADEKITDRHYNDCFETCTRFVEVVGKFRVVANLKPSDFQKAYKVFASKSDNSVASPSTIAGHIRRTVAMLNWAYDSILIDHPVRTGKQFKVPTKTTFRKYREKQPDKIFSADEIHGMISLAPVTIRAAILLGINCGFGNTDVGCLPIDLYLNRRGNWLIYPRKKTGVFRKLPLWPETITAIDKMLSRRVDPRTEKAAKSLFLTTYGNQFGKTTISTEIQKLKEKLSIKRRGCGFLSLRHCVETFGGKDQTAINVLMGHVDPHISAEYRELKHFPNDRLLKVASNVRKWLGEPKDKGSKKGERE